MFFLCLTYSISCARVRTYEDKLMKNMRNNFGVKGVTAPKASFFIDLKRPVDAKIVDCSQNVFKGIANVKVNCVDAK